MKNNDSGTNSNRIKKKRVYWSSKFHGGFPEKELPVVGQKEVTPSDDIGLCQFLHYLCRHSPVVHSDTRFPLKWELNE